jgi:hypothetical protein
MGCFSGGVEVKGTKMFARLDGVGNQYIVYSVEYASTVDTALILPLPIAECDPSIQFVPLDGYGDFFNDLASGFVPRNMGRWMQVRSDYGDLPGLRHKGIAYLPSIADFARLDEAFRPPPDFLDQFPHYRDFGFVVAKLPSTEVPFEAIGDISAEEFAERRRELLGDVPADRARLIPIAFRFATREPRCIYFPTILVQNGECRTTADFDHTLYLQHDKLGNDFALQNVGHVSLRASHFMRPVDASGVVCPRSCCFRRILRGLAANQDLWVYPPNAAARVARWQRPKTVVAAAH